MGFQNKLTQENAKKAYSLDFNKDFSNIGSFMLEDNGYRSIADIFYSNSKLKKISYINVGLTYRNSDNKLVVIDKNPLLPSLFINFITKKDENESKRFYLNLLNEHIKNIENRNCEYSDYIVTTRHNIGDYWFELDTVMNEKGTFFSIYKTNAIPKVGYPVKKYGHC